MKIMLLQSGPFIWTFEFTIMFFAGILSAIVMTVFFVLAWRLNEIRRTGEQNSNGIEEIRICLDSIEALTYLNTFKNSGLYHEHFVVYNTDTELFQLIRLAASPLKNKVTENYSDKKSTDDWKPVDGLIVIMKPNLKPPKL